ncbi:hypothetical protein [Streptomyces canus]|uniref:imine reductase family protein n=1 Tax=Streptomyces canus TaxID=58343 RepID=UPI0037F297F3
MRSRGPRRRFPRSRARPPNDSTIATHLAAMTHLIDESSAQGVSTDLPRQIKAVADRAVAEGLGRSSHAAMIGRFRSPE